MNATISVAVFIMKCMLGALSLGASIDDVRAYLGSPEDEGKGLGRVKIDRYFGGSLEISYLNGVVVVFGIYLSKGVLSDKGSSGLLALDVPTDLLKDENALLEWLSKDDLFCELVISEGGCKSWKIDNGIVVTYLDGKLDSIQLSG